MEALGKLNLSGIEVRYCLDMTGLFSLSIWADFSYCIEGIISPDGKIFGKMGHSERYSKDTFKNIDGNKNQNLILNGIKYFK